MSDPGACIRSSRDVTLEIAPFIFPFDGCLTAAEVNPPPPSTFYVIADNQINIYVNWQFWFFKSEEFSSGGQTKCWGNTFLPQSVQRRDHAGFTSCLLPLEGGAACLQLLQCVKSAGCEATVSHRTPVLPLFCLTSTLKRSVTVPHRSISAPPPCALSHQSGNLPAVDAWYGFVCFVGGGLRSSLNIDIEICLDFGW